MERADCTATPLKQRPNDAELALTPHLTRRIAAIHPDLHWEFAPGRTARHSLVVSPGG